MIDWVVVGAEENEATGTMHLAMRSGETVSVKPSLFCLAGVATFADGSCETLPVGLALELSANRLLTMNTDDYSELMDALDVGRFFSRLSCRIH